MFNGQLSDIIIFISHEYILCHVTHLISCIRATKAAYDFIRTEAPGLRDIFFQSLIGHINIQSRYISILAEVISKIFIVCKIEFNFFASDR